MPYAALTAAAPANPETSLHPPPIATKPRGNPNLGLAPAQPARGLDPRGTHTRRGCPRRSPTIDSKLRCCMHGGRSPVRARPRAYPGGGPGGRIRVRDARVIHGSFGANAHADNRHRLTLMRISRVVIALDRCHAHLPPAFAAHRPPQREPTPGPTAPFKPSRIDPYTCECHASAPTVWLGSNCWEPPKDPAPRAPFRDRRPGRTAAMIVQ